MNKLLVRSRRGNWCVWDRNPNLIPTSVLLSADTIYYNGEYIKNITGEMDVPEDISVIPKAFNVLCGNKFKFPFVRGIVFSGDFGDDYIGIYENKFLAHRKMQLKI